MSVGSYSQGHSTNISTLSLSLSGACVHPAAPTATHAEGREEERRGEEEREGKGKGKGRRKGRGKGDSSVRKKIVTEVEWGYNAMCAVMA